MKKTFSRKTLAQTTRDFGADNLRFLLIFLVVFAHLLERAPAFPGSGLLYQIIYSFHMPAFIFLFGYYAKYSPKRIAFTWIVPYFVFQTLYILFSQYVLKSDTKLQYTTPYWILWYLLACIFYLLLIPLYDVAGKRCPWVIFFASVALALFAGYDKTVGYTMSLSRFVVFQPWFLLGFYCRKTGLAEKLRLSVKGRLILGGVSVVLIALSAWLMKRIQIPSAILYGSYAYSGTERTLWMRGTSMLIAFVWIVFLFFAVRPFLGKRIPVITHIGQNTLPVFLIHGFIARYIPVFHSHLLRSPWLLLLLTCLIVLLLGNALCKKVVYYAGFSWLERLVKWNEPSDHGK